jgi:hypothetical protein
VRVDPAKYGCTVREAWFGDDGWQHLEGEPFEESDVLAFAIASPTCIECGGTGERFEHADTCTDDLCPLNGDQHSCTGAVVQCECIAPGATLVVPGPFHHSPQKGPPGLCFAAQVWDGEGRSVATLDGTHDPGVATALAALIAQALNGTV